MLTQVQYAFERRGAPSSAASKRRSRLAPVATVAEPGKSQSLHAIKCVLRNVMVHEKAIVTSWCSHNAAQMRGALESTQALQDYPTRDMQARQHALQAKWLQLTNDLSCKYCACM